MGFVTSRMQTNPFIWLLVSNIRPGTMVKFTSIPSMSPCYAGLVLPSQVNAVQGIGIGDIKQNHSIDIHSTEALIIYSTHSVLGHVPIQFLTTGIQFTTSPGNFVNSTHFHTIPHNTKTISDSRRPESPFTGSYIIAHIML